MLIAARPTAFIESAENRNGNIAPTNNAAITEGLVTLIITSTPGFTASKAVMKAAKRASAVKAAEPIANPLPIAAVVLPTASSLSVRSRTSPGSSAISAMPPALSEIGP